MCSRALTTLVPYHSERSLNMVTTTRRNRFELRDDAAGLIERLEQRRAIDEETSWILGEYFSDFPRQQPEWPAQLPTNLRYGDDTAVDERQQIFPCWSGGPQR